MKNFSEKGRAPRNREALPSFIVAYWIRPMAVCVTWSKVVSDFALA